MDLPTHQERLLQQKLLPTVILFRSLPIRLLLLEETGVVRTRRTLQSSQRFEPGADIRECHSSIVFHEIVTPLRLIHDLFDHDYLTTVYYLGWFDPVNLDFPYLFIHSIIMIDDFAFLLQTWFWDVIWGHGWYGKN